MNVERCEGCGNEFPLGETFKIRDVVYCRECGNEVIEGQGEIDEDEIEQQIDPTVCVNCQKDNGKELLGMVAELPVCGQCEEFLRNRPFPVWIKVAAAVVIAFVGFSLFWNMRFIQGYNKIYQAIEAFSQADSANAALLMRSASDHVPECHDLEMTACFYEGLHYLQEDEPEEALSLFKQCRDTLPPDMGVDDLILYAEINVAFDKGDYDRFLELALQMSKEDPEDPTSVAQVASAYACKYAETGEEGFKKNALEYLEKAKKIGEGDQDFEEYEQRILHRLYSREIIKRKEFMERFPDGWQEPGKEES